MVAALVPPANPRIEVPGGVVEIVLAGRPALVSDQQLVAWVESAARAIAAYYGTFPVRRVVLTIHGGGSGRITSGRTDGVDGEATIEISVGDAATPADLASNWELVHEMVHLAFPSMRRQAWIEEGLATYVEPLVRARAGLAPADDIWKWLLWGLPRGQQALTPGGLDGARSWAATYWGGALYCFDADVGIRQRRRHLRGAVSDRPALRHHRRRGRHLQHRDGHLPRGSHSGTQRHVRQPDHVYRGSRRDCDDGR